MSEIALDINAVLAALAAGKTEDSLGWPKSGTPTQAGNLTAGNTTATGTSAGRPELFPPTFDAASLGVILMTVKTKLSNEQLQTTASSIETNKQITAEKHKEVIEKIRESIESLEKSKKGGICQKIFGWAAVIITAIAAVALMVVTAGAAAPLAGVMLALAVDQAVGMATGHSAMGEITQGLGKAFAAILEPFIGEEKAALAGQIIATVVVTVAMIALTMGAGSASAAALAANNTAKLIHSASMIAMGASAVGSGSAGIATGFYERDAAEAQIEKMDIKKILAKLQARMEEDTDRLKAILEELDESIAGIFKMQDNETQTMNNIIQHTV